MSKGLSVLFIGKSMNLTVGNTFFTSLSIKWGAKPSRGAKIVPLFEMKPGRQRTTRSVAQDAEKSRSLAGERDLIEGN